VTDRPRSVRRGPRVLEDTRKLARLTSRDLWLRYLALGGNASPQQVDAYLADTQEATRREYNILVDALNERLSDINLVQRLAYTP
jgi:hypothetical protein